MKISKESISNQIKDQHIKQILNRHNYIANAKRAAKWIDRYTVKNHGIVITSKQRREYQEVTGYFIPTLLQWGFRERAIEYAKWLCSVQGESGAFRTSDDKYDSVFNTGQVLRGLVAVCEIAPEVYEPMIKGADWLLDQIDDEGRMRAIDESLWAAGHKCSELIHIYCLSPLITVSEITKDDKYKVAVQRALKYYKDKYINDITNFNYLSHFYAYVLEALVDLGETELVRSCMHEMEKIQGLTGAVPAYKNCKWVCSTGLFQLAIIWFKLGDFKHGDKAFDYACSLQNKSGGWYGSYLPGAYRAIPVLSDITNEKIWKPQYFPEEEISWAVKYFFDALYYRQKLNFELRANTFISRIGRNDWKYKAVSNIVSQYSLDGKVLDVGCGKGRYLTQLNNEYPNVKYYGVDISEKVLKYVKSKNISVGTGSSLNIPFENESMDVVISCEAIEHAILLENAVHEFGRVIKKNGTVIIIDKENSVTDQVKYQKWFEPEELKTKQYIDSNRLSKIMRAEGFQVEILRENAGKQDGIFTAWIGRKM